MEHDIEMQLVTILEIFKEICIQNLWIAISELENG